MQRNTLLLLATLLSAAALTITEFGVFSLPDFISGAISTVCLTILLITLLDIVVMAKANTEYKSESQ
ncbi:hypothetical protein [Shewanella sp. GXUN23E]|uniref:hypothetical protein n=1 Tax=Shewanella sp. GXUN23E TaxID=3422498 RepID=UPI003D7DACFE